MRNPYLYRGLAVLMILALGLYLLVDRVLMPNSTRQHAVVTVPDLTGLHIDSALAGLANHAFELGDTLELFDPEFNESRRRQVIDQNPKPGAKAKLGRRIFLYLPRGASRDAIVPEVAGQSPRNARALVEAAGLIVRGVLPDSIPSHLDGPVTRSAPGAGTMLTRGDSVVVYYGTGPDENRLVEVPDLTGLPTWTAQQRLRALDLSASVLDQAEADSSLDTFFVRRQNPEAGALIPAGTRIRLYTSGDN